MKIRSGFVSNSSSSSFAISMYGIEVDSKNVKKIMKQYIEKNYKKDLEKITDEDEKEEFYKEYEYEIDGTKLKDIFDDIDNDDIVVYCSSLGDSYSDKAFWCGRDFSSMKDDETGKQFKESTQKVIKELFGRDCKKIEDSWGWMDN